MKTKFLRWANAYGLDKLASDLGVSRRAIYHWGYGARNGREIYPRPDTAQRIVCLAEGQLEISDVLTFLKKTETTKTTRRKIHNG